MKHAVFYIHIKDAGQSQNTISVFEYQNTLVELFQISGAT
jgi:hypothetical protein